MITLLRSTCPFPTIDALGDMQDGLYVSRARRCHKCKTKSCKERLAGPSPTEMSHAVCPAGFSTILIPTNYGNLLVNGVFVPFHNTVMNAQGRKENRSQKVPWESLQTYYDSLTLVGAILQQQIERRAMEAVSGLHDIKTAVSVVFRNAEAIIANLPGYDDAEKIDRADDSLKALLKSVNLLKSRLEMASIVANPEAARYGRPRKTPVYQVFHLMIRLFEEEARRRGVRLRMQGSSHAVPMLFDSFETIPLVLIDNAVKYSERNNEVIVRVVDAPGQPDGCTVSVESRGHLVPPEDRASIFARGFRAPQAKLAASSGSGLGLFIAKIVADANECTLQYSAKLLSRNDGVGVNVFTVGIRSLDVSTMTKRF